MTSAQPPSLTLPAVVAEVEAHVASAGWDAPPRLFALVPTADLVRREPELAAQLGLAPDGDHDGALTPVEQEALPPGRSLEESLARVAWPDEVVGAALVVERLVVPPSVEAQMPRDEQEALAWLADHPQRQEVRLAVGVLRDGHQAGVLRLRSHDSDQERLRADDLAPGLAAALAATFED